MPDWELCTSYECAEVVNPFTWAEAMTSDSSVT